MLVAERGVFIGEILRELRREYAYTQKDLAAVANLNEIMISELAYGSRRSRPLVVLKLTDRDFVEVRHRR